MLPCRCGSYPAVLYLRPRVEFTLRGEPIAPRCAIQRLEVEYYQFEPYTPKGVPAAGSGRKSSFFTVLKPVRTAVTTHKASPSLRCSRVKQLKEDS